MFSIAIMVKHVIHLLVGIMFLQMFGSMPQDDQEDPFARATTPTEQFLRFKNDFAQMDADLIIKWLNPDLGLVKDGVLLTYNEASQVFTEEFKSAGTNAVLDMNIVFNHGEFSGANMYQADCWVEWKMKVQNEISWLRFHHQFVFKIINQNWYLVQSEFMPGDTDLPIEFQASPSDSEIPDWAKQYQSDTSGTALSGIATWPLLLGSNYDSAAELHPVSGTMFNGDIWSLKAAVSENKPTVLFFMSIQSYLVIEGADFDGQMEFLSSLYDEFGLDEIYIFGVSDEVKERFEMLADDGYDNFVPLLDEDSSLHTSMNISEHPYIVVLDASGTVIALTKSWHPSSLGILKARIREAVTSSRN